jgi:LysR family transcriptional regulator, chromosome initiation inhibitor
MLDYAQLDALAAVVREGSFEAAARALHITPSALSQRIAKLEHRLGGVLVLRAKPCRATPLGEPLLRHAQQVALLEQALPQVAPRAAGNRPGAPASLAIAVNADSLATWFLPAVAPLAHEHGLLLDLRVDDEGHTQELLRRGEVLAAVTTHAAPVQGCRSLRLGRLRYRATASPGFARQWFPQGITPARLAQAPMLRFNEKDEMQHRWLRRWFFKGRRKDLHPPAHRLPSSQGFVQATEAGLGWTLNPEPLLKEALAAGRIVDLAPEQPFDVALHLQLSRLPLPALQVLERCLLTAAGHQLRPPR